MSTQPQGFGQQGAFGAQPPAPEPLDAAPEPGPGSKRTLLIAGGAGVLALAVLGGAAALVLTGGADDEAFDGALPPASVAPAPSVEPSLAPATPLPTAVIKGRNVFEPLVGPKDGAGGDAADGSGSGVDVGGVETTSPTSGTDLSTSIPTSFPTTAPTTLPLPGGGGLPGVDYGSAPTVTVTVTGPPIPGEPIPGPTTTVPGPTETITVEKPVEVQVPGAKSVQIVVRAVEVPDSTTATGTRNEYRADFIVDGDEYLDLAPLGPSFGPKDAYRYISYGPISQQLSFIYGSALFTVTVPLAPTEPAPTAISSPTD